MWEKAVDVTISKDAALLLRKYIHKNIKLKINFSLVIHLKKKLLKCLNFCCCKGCCKCLSQHRIFN